jgi:hypothetical protein
VPDKYEAEGLKVLKALRDEGPKSPEQVKALMRGSACRVDVLTRLLKSAQLVKRTVGSGSKYYLRDA